jgi:hypothetical protein
MAVFCCRPFPDFDRVFLPVSQLPISQYTDELIVLQGLRAVVYMDLGSNQLPWAPGTLYDWMKSKMTGISPCAPRPVQHAQDRSGLWRSDILH